MTAYEFARSVALSDSVNTSVKRKQIVQLSPICQCQPLFLNNMNGHNQTHPATF